MSFAMFRNQSVTNTKTGTIHYGTVDNSTEKVVKVYCGKPVHDKYVPTKAKIKCVVCKTKLLGKRVGYRPRRRRRKI